MTEWVFFLNPETQGADFLEARECIICRSCKPLGDMMGNKCIPCSSRQLCIDPHTQGMVYTKGQRCEKCDKWKSKESFYEKSLSCILCYDRHWNIKNEEKEHWSLAAHLHKTQMKANRRSRFRKAKGDYITFADVERLWHTCHGTCAHCNVALTWEWHPRKNNKNFGVLDRVSTERNATYKNNAQFLCHWCNTEKGAWDLVEQQNQTIQKQKRKIKNLTEKLRKARKKQKRGISYASILIQ